MASSYKYIGPNDRVVSSTPLAESVSNAAGAGWSASDKTNFARVASSGADVFDVTVGRSSVTVGTSAETLKKEQIIYNQLAKVLLGTDVSGNVAKFYLNTTDSNSEDVLHNAIFINFNRSQFKDKIKKGTFSLLVNPSGSSKVYLTDKSGTLGPTVRECETGEYGILYVSSSVDTTGLHGSANLTGGLVFYEAGIAAISPYVFSAYSANPPPSSSNATFNSNSKGLMSVASTAFSGTSPVGDVIVSSSISSSAYGMYSHLLTASYQAVTELNSTVYFCRAFNNEFNYSSNPTYLSSSQIVVKEGDPMNQPLAYITSVGLYDDKDQLLAVAKLSEPIKKTPDTELIARVRLDF